MSSVSIQGNASGTGIFTIASPNSNTNRTLTLPDATGTIITTAGGAAISGTTGAFTTTVGVGGATPAASGAGITFPATASASSDANTLDDYEEGTWTPTVIGGTTAGTTTYTAQNGFYTKIGNQVTVICYINYSAMTGTGVMQVNNLPFASANLTQGYSVSSFLPSNLNWGGGTYIVALQTPNTSIVEFYYASDDGVATQQNCVNETAILRFTMTYFTT